MMNFVTKLSGFVGKKSYLARITHYRGRLFRSFWFHLGCKKYGLASGSRHVRHGHDTPCVGF